MIEDVQEKEHGQGAMEGTFVFIRGEKWWYELDGERQVAPSPF